MPFIWGREKFDGRQGRVTDTGDREYTRIFQAKSDDKLVGPIEAAFAPGLPRLGDPYVSHETNEFDLFCLCRDIRAVQDSDDWQIWNIQVDYSTISRGGELRGQPTGADAYGQPNNSGGSGSAGDPSLELPVVQWGAATRDIFQVRDLSDASSANPFDPGAVGVPIVNSAGQPFDPPPAIETAYQTLMFERNEAEFDHDRMGQFALSVNELQFLGYDPQMVLCRPITANRVFRGSLGYWRVKYEFWFNPPTGTWQTKLLNQGLMQLDLATGKPTPITKKGQPITQPAFLDLLTGREITAAELEDILDGTEEPPYKTFQTRHVMDFDELEIVLP